MVATRVHEVGMEPKGNKSWKLSSVLDVFLASDADKAAEKAEDSVINKSADSAADNAVDKPLEGVFANAEYEPAVEEWSEGPDEETVVETCKSGVATETRKSVERMETKGDETTVELESASQLEKTGQVTETMETTDPEKRRKSGGEPSDPTYRCCAPWG